MKFKKGEIVKLNDKISEKEYNKLRDQIITSDISSYNIADYSTFKRYADRDAGRYIIKRVCKYRIYTDRGLLYNFQIMKIFNLQDKINVIKKLMRS
jgi:hypothetical protein